MNDKSNDLVVLQWLLTPLNEQMNALHETWQGQTADNAVDFHWLAQAFHALGNVLHIANLSNFAKLAYLLEDACHHFEGEQALMAPELLYASKLLQYEINHYIMTGLDQHILVNLRTQYLQQILQPDNAPVWQADEYLSQQFEIPHTYTAMADEAYQKLALTWRQGSSQLLDSNQNNNDTLNVLAKAANYLSQATHNTSLRSLWYMVRLWLLGLDLNDEPLPHQYAYLLAQLDKVIALQHHHKDDTPILWVENLLADIYIQLSNLSVDNEEAHAVLSALTYSMANEALFFPYILGVLENMLFAMGRGEVSIETLEEVKEQLAQRGWSFYESYVAQIIEDIKSSQDDPDMFAQMQWQITTQLQDLYTAIQNTHESIQSKVGDSSLIVLMDTSDNTQDLRRVRVLVEGIKHAFNSYLYSKDATCLSEQSTFDEIGQVFADMSMYDVGVMSAKLGELFAQLKQNTPRKIGWSFAYALADGLALLELFLDGLAKQIFDQALLSKAQERLDKAYQLIDVVDQEVQLSHKTNDHQVRYDDSGEIIPTQDDSDELDDDVLADELDDELNDDKLDDELTSDNDDDKAVAVATTADSTASQSSALSQAYQNAQASLQPDSFDYDEDIREIFIEESAEVLEELDSLIPTWRHDPSNLTPLKDIRRGFHTLKGSGRMVGAYSIGEMSWAIENMLNRVLDGSLPATPQVANFVAHTKSLIPSLVADFANQQAPTLDIAAIVLQAHNLLAGKAIDEGMPVSAQHTAVSTPVTATTDTPATGTPTKHTGTQTGQTPETQHALAFLAPFIAEAQHMPALNADEVDEDIKEIYIEEAGEVLAEITPLFAKYKQKADNKRLTDIRRGFHTLKGSGRIVGAVELGELAWSIENMLNRVLDNTIKVNDGMLALVDAVLMALPEWIERFENNQKDYPPLLTLQIAAAHAYSKGHGDEFDYRALVNTNPATAITTASVADDVDDTDGTVWHSMQEAGELISQSTLQAANDDEEDMLCRIFIEEAMDLLETVSRFIDEHDDSNEAPVSDEIVRVFHTLRGALGLQPLLAIGEMGAMIEKSLQELQHHDRPMNKKHIQILGSSVRLIKNHLQAYGSDSDEMAVDSSDKDLLENLLADEAQSDGGMDVSKLIVDIDTLLDAELELEGVANQSPETVQHYAQKILQEIVILEERTTTSSKFQRLLLSLNNGYHLLYRHPEQASDDTFIDVLLSAHGELTGLFDSLAGSMSLRLDDAIIRQLDGKIADAQAYYQSLAQQAGSKADGVETDDAQPAPDSDGMVVSYQTIDTDPELLEIFLEEAGELDDAIGESFGAWKNDTSDTEALKTLQRYLHTIKGGARLAGISSMGDLTHEAETVYESMVEGRLSPSPDWINVMQGVQDILSLQIDEIKNNKRTFAVDELIAQLQAYVAAKEPPKGASVAMPILDDKDETQVETAESEQTEAPAISDFEHRQLRSWHGVLPDGDILAVFLEEAEELVESSSEDFQVFRSNTGDIATLQSLQRKLHTIKGGARMISANGLADLAHQMETVYEDLGSRRRPATRMVIQLLLSCHDWMAAAMVLLKAKLNPPTPTPLIETLENFSRRPDSLTEVPVVSLAEEVEAIAAHEAYEKQRLGGRDISRLPPSSGLFGQTEEVASNNEMIRISASLMERMINLSGEAAINRARIDMSMVSLTASIEEMGATVQRLHDQLRRMDIELESQILAQIDDKALIDSGEFDPLEMDQYSSLNQLSKSLSESASDLLDLKATLLEKTRDGENLLLQLSRTQNELQDGLMYSRMVPFSRLTPRLQRIVRQVSSELGKNVELNVINADDEIDRTILERITSPLEHMLRNAIDHGIEMPDERAAAGKPKSGKIALEVVREGSEILVHLTDDGAGINVEAVRKKAIAQGLISANDTSLSDVDIMQYIFNAGLSTTNVVTQISGRGVGMDVVRSEIRQLGGSVSVDSVRGQGSRFTMRVPLTVAVSDTLVVRAADRQYAVPLGQIERVTQLNAKTLLTYYQSNDNTLEIEGKAYRLRYLNEILSGHDFSELMSTNQSFPVILVKNQAGQNLALQVDEIVGSRIEVVVKPLGAQLSHVSGISAATIMGDGSVMFILDLMALLLNARARVAVAIEKSQEQSKRPVILVVDDSVTVRKVTSRFLERQGFEAVVAKDGVDAIEILQDLMPDLMLLDIEMPRMDGFEVATHVRRNSRLAQLPIIMITSRTGEKHRERAFEIGVTDYMGKPFQENELLERIGRHLRR